MALADSLILFLLRFAHATRNNIMAILFIDGVDHYGTDKTNMTDGAWAEVGSTDFNISAVNPRTGAHSLHFVSTSASGADTRRVFGGAKTTVGVGAAFWFSNLPTANDEAQIFGFRDTANVEQVLIILQTTGIIEVFRGIPGGTSLGVTATPAVTAEAYTHIECLVTIDNSAGAVEVRVNGVTVLSITGVDTANTSNIETSQLAIGKRAGTFNGTGIDDLYIDDMFCYDDTGSFNNTFIGDRKVITLVPDADTAQADWTPLSSTGFSNIDELDPDDDTSYISAGPSASPALSSEFGLSNLPAGVSSVSAVVMVNRMLKTDAGTADVQPSLISVSSEATGTAHVLTEAYKYYHDVVEVDPDTTSPFTPTAVDALKLKVERTA